MCIEEPSLLNKYSSHHNIFFNIFFCVLGAVKSVSKMGSFGIGVNAGKLSKTTNVVTASASKVFGVAATIHCSVGKV